MWKKIWMSTVDGYVWDDDEWMRRIEQAEDGDATASAVLALYDSLMSQDDVPSRGCGWLSGRQYRLARLASLPSAPARMLMDMSAILVDGAGSEGFDDLTVPVVYALGDNPALPSAAYDSLERAYGGDGGVCPELGVRNPVYANRVARRTTVISDDRLFVSSGFAAMRLGARGVDSGVPSCYCCVRWPRGRVVR